MSGKYQELYNSKKITVEEALSLIKSGSEIGVAAFGMEPVSILKKLHTIKDRVGDVNLVCSTPMDKYEFMMDADIARSIKCESLFFGDMLRRAHEFKGASYIPSNLHDGSIRRLDYKKQNIFIGSATTMDKHGYVRSSLSLVNEKYFLENADLVILEINPNIPVVNGETEIHISNVDYVVEVDTPVPTLGCSHVSDTEKTIGEYVASLVNDGDTIQLGIGSIPDASAMAFMDKKNLGLHTEMITNSIADLVEAGVITNKKKTLHTGKLVGAFAYGNEKLYDLLDNNPSVMIMRGDYVNDPRVVAMNDNMVSINTAIQVDLTGQVCSESMGTIQFSGSGGQFDTAFGAIHSKGGRSIIALKSTAKKGSISTILPVLTPGAVVTLSRNVVDYVVTEFGIAALRGRSVGDRVNNLIAIAHPDFRSELKKEAEKYHLW